MAGYSKKSLRDKLGIKPGCTVLFINAPRGYEKTLGKLPTGARIFKQGRGPFDFIQVFVESQKRLLFMFPSLNRSLAKHGMLWVSWPKGSSGVKTDLNENAVRGIGLHNGLVDIKVASIDEIWSGLKFVWRVKDRI